MAKRNKGPGTRRSAPARVQPLGPRRVKSLIDEMAEGREYASIAGVILDEPETALMGELRRGLKDIEAIRGKPCIGYLGHPTAPGAEMNGDDHLPLAEAVLSVPADAKEVDVFIATAGGSVEVVSKLVDVLRPRFEKVSFLVPAQALSAGTLWCLSGEEIWMDERAYLGPIDPQVIVADGRTVPLQALLHLLRRIQKDGDERLERGEQPQWTHIRLLDHMDQKEIGAAMNASDYLVEQACKYLETYKFREWQKRSDGAAVTSAYRNERAMTVAKALCDHDKWKNHSHEISRSVLWNELRLQVCEPETVSGLQSAMRRLWALWSYTFGGTTVLKATYTDTYALIRHKVQP